MTRGEVPMPDWLAITCLGLFVLAGVLAVAAWILKRTTAGASDV